MWWERAPYRATDERDAVDRDLVATFLADEAYWSPGIDRAAVDRAIDNSLCLSVFDGDAQVGFARLITDQVTLAHLCDVFVVRSHRGRGIGRWLAELAVGHPAVAGVRRMTLATADAHALYAAVGFTPLSDVATLMERRRPVSP